MSEGQTLKLVCQLYLGDPDTGAEALPVEDILTRYDALRDRVPREDLYAAVILERDGKPLATPRPDPAVRLMTNLVRTLPYVIEGEVETAVLNESAYGYLVEPNIDKVQVSFFVGHDAFEPDEYLIEAELLDMVEFADQLLSGAKALQSVLLKQDPGIAERDELIGDFGRMIELADESLHHYKLEKEHGLRQ